MSLGKLELTICIAIVSSKRSRYRLWKTVAPFVRSNLCVSVTKVHRVFKSFNLDRRSNGILFFITETAIAIHCCCRIDTLRNDTPLYFEREFYSTYRCNKPRDS